MASCRVSKLSSSFSVGAERPLSVHAEHRGDGDLGMSLGIHGNCVSINTAGLSVTWESPASGRTLHIDASLRGVFDFPGFVYSEMSVGLSKLGVIVRGLARAQGES